VCEYGNSCALVCYHLGLVHSKNENQSVRMERPTTPSQ
jgi:hypothetical protein